MSRAVQKRAGAFENVRVWAICGASICDYLRNIDVDRMEMVDV